MPGMRIEGKVLVVPEPDKNRWRVIAINTGQQELGITHNILAPGINPNQAVHDDHVQYGHGMPVAPDPTRYRELIFAKGALYNGRPIEEGSTLRVGLRSDGRVGAYKTVTLGSLNDPPKKLSIRDDFTWYGQGGPDTYQSNTAGMAGYEAQARQKPVNGNDAAALEAFVDNLIAGKEGRALVKCKGACTIDPVADARGNLSHWVVKFENKGDPVVNEMAFIGTIAFDVPNDGKKGLESMAVPYKTSVAAQTIPYRGGGYAVLPEPGAQVRVGVRGFGVQNVALPAVGQRVALKIEEMPRIYEQSDPEFFDAKAVEEKRREKANKVAFADNGAPLQNLGPVVYRGAKAKQESNFEAPHLVIRSVPADAEHPQGGWQIEMTNRMPNQVKGQGVGFIGTLRLDAPANAAARDQHRVPGKDVNIAPPKKFLQNNETKSWFIPKNADMNGVVAAPGQKVLLGTRGLGWFTEFALPADGAEIDSDKDDQLWGLRTDQVNPDLLTHQYVNQVKD